MERVSWGKAIGAGLAGTASMTVLMLTAPMMGMPRMPIGEMLGSFLGIGPEAGWAMHAAIGIMLAAIYAVGLNERLPGRPWLRGASYGVVVFFVAQLVVIPMMGGGVFSGGNVMMIAGSLAGHLVFGVIVGAVYGQESSARVLSRA